MLARAPLWHRAAEWLLHALAFSAVVAIVLILVFIAKEAAPILYSKVVRDEVTLAKMWWPQLWPGYDEAASVWQPVSDIPKFGVWPLILGTLKVTIVAMAVSVPLGVGAAVYVSQYARPAHARDRQAGRRAAGRNPVGGAGLLRADGDGDLVPGPVRTWNRA